MLINKNYKKISILLLFQSQEEIYRRIRLVTSDLIAVEALWLDRFSCINVNLVKQLQKVMCLTKPETEPIPHAGCNLEPRLDIIVAISGDRSLLKSHTAHLLRTISFLLRSLRERIANGESVQRINT